VQDVAQRSGLHVGHVSDAAIHGSRQMVKPGKLEVLARPC
jgi:hypothetical protein